MDDVLQMILDRLDRMDADRDDARRDAKQDAATAVREAKLERAELTSKITSLADEVVPRLARLEVKLDYTNGKVRRGEELDGVHATSITAVTRRVDQIEEARERGRWAFRLMSRPVLWVATLAGSGVIGALIKTATG